MEKVADLVVNYLGRSDGDNMSVLSRNVEMLCSRANDIENKVRKQEMSCKSKRKREVEEWLKQVRTLKPECEKLETRVRRRWLPLIGDPVGKMLNHVTELTEQSQHFNGLVLYDSENNAGQLCLPTKIFGQSINENLQKIWSCLVDDGIPRIGIYGMGGVGKTALAKHLKDQLQKSHYRVFWVTVSQNFSIAGLQDMLAHLMGLRPLLSKDSEEKRADILREALSMEQVVIVLDDVWEGFCAHKLGLCLGSNKCRLILTTRLEVVCDQMCCERKFHVTCLDENEGWDLFKWTLGFETLVSEEVGVMAESVSNRCGGLPLAIITVAERMRKIVDIREWRVTLQLLKLCSVGYREMEDNVFRILEWSFNHLSDCEKHCFLYCCLYPEDFRLEREELVQLFSLAKLVQRRRTLALECDHGHMILNSLIKHGLLEETKGDNGVYLKIHRLIRDMGVRITTGHHISKTAKQYVPRFLVKREKEISVEKDECNINAVSWTCSGDDGVDIGELSPSCWNSPTLTIIDCSNETAESLFSRMQGLKFVNLVGCFGLEVLPSCISDLVNLTGLLLGCSPNITSVPPLGKLANLRTLDLSKTSLCHLPQGLEELVNLERIVMKFSKDYSRENGPVLPVEAFSKLKRLQHLELLGPVYISDPTVLNDLLVFRGQLSVNIGSFNQFMKSGSWPKHQFDAVVISDLQVKDWHLHKPFIVSTGVSKNLKFQWCTFLTGSVLPPEDTQSLKLINCLGLSDVFFQNLLTNGRSKHLSHLEIWFSKEVEFLLSMPLDDADVALQNLQELMLCSLPKFAGLVNCALTPLPPAATFSSLRSLYISECDGMRKLFSLQLLNHNFQNLQVLTVSRCEQLEEIVAVDDESQNVILPKLQEMSLFVLPMLVNVCKATMVCDSIKNLEIHRCSEVKRLPLFLSTSARHPTTLKTIRGSKEWWNQLQWDGNHHSKDAHQPFFQDSIPVKWVKDDITMIQRHQRQPNDYAISRKRTKFPT